MKRRWTLLLAAAALLAAHPAFAQSGGAGGGAPLPAVRQTVVAFTVSGRVPVSAGDEVPAGLPLPLIARLSTDEALARLEVGTGDVFTASFVFAEQQSFRAWIERPATRAMLDALRAALNGTETRLSIARYPMADWVKP